MQNLSPIGWALRPLKNYAKFSGRASRAEFWWFTLFMIVIYFGFWIAVVASIGASAASGMRPGLGMFGAIGVAGIFMVLLWLALLIPSIAVQVRRLHDTNRSGWWLGGFWLLYLAYMALAFGRAFSTPNSAPNVGGAAAFGIIALVFLGYSIVLLVFWCLRGTEGPNRFGEDPYGEDVAEVFA